MKNGYIIYLMLLYRKLLLQFDEEVKDVNVEFQGVRETFVVLGAEYSA